jgi:hypothetical protein
MGSRITCGRKDLGCDQRGTERQLRTLLGPLPLDVRHLPTDAELYPDAVFGPGPIPTRLEAPEEQKAPLCGAFSKRMKC